MALNHLFFSKSCQNKAHSHTHLNMVTSNYEQGGVHIHISTETLPLNFSGSRTAVKKSDLLFGGTTASMTRNVCLKSYSSHFENLQKESAAHLFVQPIHQSTSAAALGQLASLKTHNVTDICNQHVLATPTLFSYNRLAIKCFCKI